MQQGTKVILQNIWQSKITFPPEYKVLCLGQIQYNTLLSTSIVVAHHVMSMLVIIEDWGVFQDKKTNGMELNTGNILEENLIQSAIHQKLGDEFTFQQAKSTLELLTYQEDIEFC